MKQILTFLLLCITITNFSQESKFTTIIEVEEEMDENDPIPFSIIDEVPIFPGCESLDKAGQKQCIQKGFQKIVARNFNTDIANCIERKLILNEETGKEEEKCVSLSSGKKRMYLQFRIDATGEVQDIRVRAPHPELKKEAIRIAKLIPKMKPGKQRGKAISVAYTMPITFTVK